MNLELLDICVFCKISQILKGMISIVFYSLIEGLGQVVICRSDQGIGLFPCTLEIELGRAHLANGSGHFNGTKRMVLGVRDLDDRAVDVAYGPL